MSTPKLPPESLALRAPPRPVTRLNRRTMIAGVALVSAVILGVTLWSLQPLRKTSEVPVELHNVDRIAHAEGLAQLPSDYTKLPPTAPAANAPPQLGPPLPGDLGGPLLRAQRAAEADANHDPSASGLRPDPAADAARVERINRQREAEDAAKAPLFFRGSARKEISAPTVSPPPAPGALTAIDNATAISPAAPPPVSSTQTPQEQKRAFLERASDSNTQSPHALQLPRSPYQVMAGTIIPAALITGIDSDLPGPVLANVTEGVYDSATGRHLLIPQGTRLVGEYDSQVVFGQRRVLLVWTRLIFPDTSSLVLDRLPGVDASGYAGLQDGIDFHWRELLAGAALATLIGVGAELASPDRSSSQGQVIVATRQSAQDSVNQVGQELTRRNLSVQPTLTIRPGFPLRVIVSRDLVLRPYQPLIFERGLR
jgi:type IV secretion system protein VirB10